MDIRCTLGGGRTELVVEGGNAVAATEAARQVRAALTGMGLALPLRRLHVRLQGLSSSDSARDLALAIAVAVLAALEVLPAERLAQFAVVGGLSALGVVLPISGMAEAVQAASALGLGLICPAGPDTDAVLVPWLEVLPVPDLMAVINHFRNVQATDGADAIKRMKRPQRFLQLPGRQLT